MVREITHPSHYHLHLHCHNSIRENCQYRKDPSQIISLSSQDNAITLKQIEIQLPRHWCIHWAVNRVTKQGATVKIIHKKKNDWKQTETFSWDLSQNLFSSWWTILSSNRATSFNEIPFNICHKICLICLNFPCPICPLQSACECSVTRKQPIFLARLHIPHKNRIIKFFLIVTSSKEG